MIRKDNRVALGKIDNKRNRIGVGSNDMGIFEIRAFIGDTLVITNRGFVDLTVVIKSSSDLILHLYHGTTLNAVVINAKSKAQSLAEVIRDFRNKGSFYAGRPPDRLLSPFGGSPLTFFYELFGRTPKNARRYEKYQQKELKELFVDHFFNRTVVAEQTRLTGTDLDEFMMSNRPSYHMVKDWTNYDTTKYVSTQ